MPVPIYEDTKPKERKTMKFCKDCKWAIQHQNELRARCTHPRVPPLSEESINPVTGYKTPKKYRFCSNLREDIGVMDTIFTYVFDSYTLCGSEGRKWEAKNDA